MSAAALSLPVFIKSFGLGEGVKGGPISFEGKVGWCSLKPVEPRVESALD